MSTTKTARETELKKRLLSEYQDKRKRVLGACSEPVPEPAVTSTAAPVGTTLDDGHVWLHDIIDCPFGNPWQTTVYDPEYWDPAVRQFIPKPNPSYKYRAVYSTFHMLLDMGLVGGLVGEAGTGKDEMAKQYAAVKRMPYRRITGDKRMTTDMIIGRRTMEDGTIRWESGELEMMARHGGVVVLSEPFAMPPDTLFAVQSMTERNGYLSMVEHPDPMCRMLPVSKDCRIVLTTNTRGFGDDIDKYSATGVMDASTLNRLEYMLQVDHLDPSVEATVILDIVDDPSLATDMVKLGNLIRQAWRTGTVEATWSLRSLIPWAEVYSKTKNNAFAFKATFWGKLSDEERGVVRGLWRDVGFRETL